MALGAPPNRFALLVGVDVYLTGDRKDEKNESISIKNLEGCTNDVRAMDDFLHTHFQPLKARTLTSSAPPSPDKSSGSDEPSDSDEPSQPKEPPKPVEPSEPEAQWPTFKNIKKSFDYVYKHTKPGDLFLFYFSGHGARLKPIKETPANKKVDPSLLTLDYRREKPPVRGWQLNRWLEDLHDKGVVVLVILDSCYAGSVLREGSMRTAGDFTQVPNLPSDVTAANLSLAPGNRNAEMERSWAINPQYCTIMAACAADEAAEEIKYQHEVRGVFTYALLSHFGPQRRGGPDPDLFLSRYYDIRNEIAVEMKKQKPQLYGRDSLHFFGTFEPFAVASLPIRIEEKKGKGECAVIPTGRAHGIGENAEFEVYSATSSQVLRVSAIDALECHTPVTADEVRRLNQAGNVVIPSRWSLDYDFPEISVSANLGEVFREALRDSLRSRFVNEINVTTFESVHSSNPERIRLEKRGENGVDIFGPEYLIGYSGPIRALNIEQDDVQGLAAEAAISLSHLVRFDQILKLRSEQPDDEKEFTVSIQSSQESTEPFLEGEKFKLNFRNNSRHDDLYLTVIFLGPGFCVSQLYPPTGNSGRVAPGGGKLINLQSIILEELKRGVGAEGFVHRDIIRAIVSKGSAVSWKTQELPDIWNAKRQVDETYLKKVGRLLRAVEEVEWWIVDMKILTKQKR